MYILKVHGVEINYIHHSKSIQWNSTWYFKHYTHTFKRYTHIPIYC